MKVKNRAPFIVNWETPAMRETEKSGYAVLEIKVMK